MRSNTNSTTTFVYNAAWLTRLTVIVLCVFLVLSLEAQNERESNQTDIPSVAIALDRDVIEVHQDFHGDTVQLFGSMPKGTAILSAACTAGISVVQAIPKSFTRN